VPAGAAVFAIHNASERGVEWEILDGVMVLEERENIAPGFTQRLTTQLRAGDFAMTCGLLSNPHGSLHVTPSASGAQIAAAPLSDVDFIGPLSEYSVFLGIQFGSLSDAIQHLSDAVNAGDLDAARRAYIGAHENFMRVAPVVTLFADLDHRIDAHAIQFDKGELDPAFVGFDRIAYGLFGENQTASLTPYITALAADVTTLTNRVNDVVIQPNQLSTLAARWLERTASAQDGTRRPAYVTDSAAQIAGTVEGVKQIYTLLMPALKTQAALSASISDDLAAVQKTLTTLKTPDGYVADASISTADRATLAKQLRSLADAFQRVNPALGLDTMSSK
jgi:iron uptake system component EfeO